MLLWEWCMRVLSNADYEIRGSFGIRENPIRERLEKIFSPFCRPRWTKFGFPFILSDGCCDHVEYCKYPLHHNSLQCKIPRRCGTNEAGETSVSSLARDSLCFDPFWSMSFAGLDNIASLAYVRDKFGQVFPLTNCLLGNFLSDIYLLCLQVEGALKEQGVLRLNVAESPWSNSLPL
jgi:hypothetical protein